MTRSADPAVSQAIDFEPLEYRPGLHLLAHRGVMQPAKTVLFFHGGGWFAGDPLQFAPQCAVLAKHGIAGVTAEYRLHARHGTMVHEAIEDAIAATARLRQLRPHSRLFLCGASAGGLLAILAAAGAAIDGLILFNPVLDLSSEGFSNKAVPAGGDIGISPMHMAKAALPPMLVMQGTADTVTPADGAQRYVDAVNAAAGAATLVTYSGGHGFFNTPRFLEVTTTVLRQFVEATAIRGGDG